MTKNNSEHPDDESSEILSAEESSYIAAEDKGLFGSAHNLNTIDDSAAQLFKELTETGTEIESTSQAYEIPVLAEGEFLAVEAIESAEDDIHEEFLEDDIDDFIKEEFIEDEEESAHHPEPIHKDTLSYDALQPDSTYTANPAYTTGAHIDPRVKDEGIKIPLAPVYPSDKIALVLAIISTVLILLCAFIIPAFYAGNLSNTAVLILVIIPSVTTLITVLCAVPGLIAKRQLP